MANWNERIVVYKTPNFYTEAVYLMDDYFEWKNESNEEGGQAIPWQEKHLVENVENFTIPASEIDELYHDVYGFLLACKRDATPILESSIELQPYFKIKPKEYTDEMPGFLRNVLIMSDVQSTEELTRDEFVTCCLIGLHEVTDKSQMENYDQGSPEEQLLFDKLGNPNFNMGEIFDTVSGVPFTDQEKMMILRFFQDIDTYYEKIRSTLRQLEVICRQNYGLVMERWEEKIQLLETDEGKSHYKEWIDKAKFQLEDFRKDEPIYVDVGIVAYGSLAIRFSSWNRLKLRLSVGLLFAELHILEDKGKYRDKMTQRQLKAIADPTRYKIIRQLSIRPHYVQELADALDLTAATLSHHLSHLLQVLLVGVSVEGRKSYYTLNADELTQLSKTLNLMAQRSRKEE